MNKLLSSSTLLIIAIFTIFSEDCLVSGSCSTIISSFCEKGHHCCDSYRCCPDIDILGIGPIIGIVIGSLTFLGSCISIICCLVNKKNRPGQVIQPHPNAGNMAAYPGGQFPPQYGQQGTGQPSYGQQSYGQQHPFGTPVNVMGQTTVGSSQPMKNQADPPPPPAAY